MEIHYRRFREIPAVISEGLRSEGRVYTLLVHELGYRLGERLYRLYLHGRISRKEVRRLFFMKFEESGQAFEIYLRLARKYERWREGSRRRKAEGGRRKAESGRQKSKGRRQKAEARRIRGRKKEEVSRFEPASFGGN
ncbi:MAG TPA: hypothetical protein VGL91_07595 [Acidobacteriota bacterium]